MNKPTSFIARSLIASSFFGVAASATAVEEGIVKNSDGDYVITYKSDTGEIKEGLWVPATKIDPKVKWSVGLNTNSGTLTYRYVFKNRGTGMQDLEAARTVVSSVVSNTQVGPKGWNTRMTSDSGRSSGIIVAWSFQTNGGIKPGSHQERFGFDSNDLPGVGVIRLFGFVSIFPLKRIFPDDGPSETNPIRKQFNDLHADDFVPRNTAIPKISVGNPVDSASTLDALRAHITGDIVAMKLIDATFASQLDRLLQAAANAVRLNNIKAAREQIKEALELLRKERTDMDEEDSDKDDDKDDYAKSKTTSPLIDRLAARAIAFDLRYVENRSKDSGKSKDSPKS